MTEPLDIDALRADLADTLACLKNERQRAGELIRERDAEIARLTGLATYDHGHNEPCLMCGKPCNSLAGNPALWALRLGNDGWHHTGCVNDALRELARLRAPPPTNPDAWKRGSPASPEYINSLPEDDRVHYEASDEASAPHGADVLERASEAVDSWESGDGFTMAEHVASALQQYGDERAAAARAAWPPNTAEPTDPETGTPLDREPALWLRDRWVYTQRSALDAIAAAREAAIEEAAQKHDRWAAKARARADDSYNRGNPHGRAFEMTEIHVHEASAADLRALAAKPGSDP